MTLCTTSARSLWVSSSSPLHVAPLPSPRNDNTTQEALLETLSPSSNSHTQQPPAETAQVEPSSEPSKCNQPPLRLPSFHGYGNNHLLATPWIGPKRVEDVKLNRIDKCRSSRRRKNHRKPFVFKSSPLAEGRSAGRLNVFTGTPFTRFSKITTLSRNPSPPLNPRHAGLRPSFNKDIWGSTLSAISKCNSSPQNLESLPASTPLISRAVLYKREKSPIIGSQITGTQSKYLPVLSHTQIPEYQKWEIALPKCILFNFEAQTR